MLTPSDRTTHFPGRLPCSRAVHFLSRTLRSSTLVALAPTVPGFLARSARAAEPGATTACWSSSSSTAATTGSTPSCPTRDEGYAAASHGHSAWRRSDLIKIDDQVGLHPAMPDAAAPAGDRAGWRSCQGVGYPNPNRSHFESMAIWQTARPDAAERQAQAGSAGCWTGRAATAALPVRRRSSSAAGPIASRRARPPVGCDRPWNRTEDFTPRPDGRAARVAQA